MNVYSNDYQPNGDRGACLPHTILQRRQCRNDWNVATPATSQRLQHLTICKIQNGQQGALKWPTMSGERFNPSLLDPLINFCLINFQFEYSFYESLKNPKWPPLKLFNQRLNTSSCSSACLPVPVSFTNVVQRRQLSYDIARLHLTTPMDFWRNSTPFFSVQQKMVILEDDFDNSNEHYKMKTA